MKRVDRLAGGLGCFLFDMLDKLRRPFSRRRGKLDGVKTVLITKYLGLGSIVLAAPFVKQVRARFPGARILFLTFEENRVLAEMIGGYDEVLSIRSSRLDRLAFDSLKVL